MDAHSSSSGDLNDLERQLSEWRPSTAGLDADRVLFAAGRASVRPGWGRIAWPILSGCLALLTAVLGVGLLQERTACLELTAQLHRPAVAPAPSDIQNPTTGPSAEPPAADSYFAARRALSDNPDGWLAVAKVDPSERPSPSRPILKAGSRADVLEP
jgi:hypothetical protein